MRRKWPFLASGMVVAALALACSGSDGSTPSEPDVTVTLALGQSVAVDGADLTFEAVPTDTRCPQDVECVWAGDALVELRWQGADVELHTGVEPRSAGLGPTTVTLVALAPQPYANATIPPQAYRATLRLTAR